MWKAILIEAAIIILLGFAFCLVVKKNKTLRSELEISNKVKDQAIDNGIHFRAIIKKLNQREAESEEVKKQIDVATGSDLANLANSL